MIQGNYNNIPGTLKALPNWVGFRVWRDEKENKYKKMPIDIKASVAAKKADPARWQDVPAESNNPKTWCDFDTAVSWAKSKKSGNKYFWYIGFAFDGGGLCGIDLDKCVGADNGLSAFAQEVLGEVQSYAEYSPTGTGVHIIARHTKPFAARKNAVIEAYNNGRFFTVTGAGLADRTTDVNDCTDAVLGVIEKQFGMPNGENADGGDGALLPLSPREAREIKSLKFKEPPEDSWTDSKIIERAKAARRTGSEFTALYAGDWRSQGFPSQSEADLALCGRLAFWTRRDFSQIDRIFRSSGLYRPKWDKAHYGGGVTYGENTIAKAIRDCGTTYGDNTTQRKRQAKVQGQTDTATVNASQATVSGVYIADNAYYMDKGKDVKRLTNFIIEPLEIVTVDNENSMNVRLKNTRGNTAVVRLRFTDFNSVSAMRGAIGALDFITVCSDTELQYIRDFVSQLPCPEKRGYKGIGIDFVDDGSGFKKPAFVCASGTFGKDWTPVDSVVQAAGSIKIESEVHIPHPISKEDLLTVGKILFSYNELPKTAAVLCFTAGCFLKPHLMQSDLKYPHLIMSGEAGSGKSSTYAKVIKPIMSLEKPVSVGDITPFTFLADACSSNFLPFVVDEYKPWEMSKSNLDMIHGAL
ncbi:MAG: hypothetical protein PHC84_01085, partial [Clostridia bacterium]|nr:hypothetical protein [Clostridia bacterium]